MNKMKNKVENKQTLKKSSLSRKFQKPPSEIIIGPKRKWKPKLQKFVNKNLNMMKAHTPEPIGYSQNIKRRQLRPAHLSTGKRSYPTSEVRGSGQECQAATAQEQPTRATQVQGQGWQLKGATLHPRSGTSGGATLCLRSGVAAGRTKPTSKEWWLCGLRRAQRSYPMLKVRKGGGEEIPLLQGKEQRLRFAGVAVKR